MQMKKEYCCPAIRSISIRPRHTLLAGSPVSGNQDSLNDYINGDANNTTETRDAQGTVIWQDN